MDSKTYKAMTLREFDAAAEQFDDNSPSVYNMCRKDYPDILAEIEKEPFMDVLDCGCGTALSVAGEPGGNPTHQSHSSPW